MTQQNKFFRYKHDIKFLGEFYYLMQELRNLIQFLK